MVIVRYLLLQRLPCLAVTAKTQQSERLDGGILHRGRADLACQPDRGIAAVHRLFELARGKIPPHEAEMQFVEPAQIVPRLQAAPEVVAPRLDLPWAEKPPEAQPAVQDE